MTVMIESFFGLHSHVYRSGQWKGMKPGEKDLYVFLMAESERCRTREITATDAHVNAKVGTAPRTLCNARKKLQERGLIRYRSGPGNRYTYTICNPQTGEAYPGSPRQPIRLPKRGEKPINYRECGTAEPELHDLRADAHGLPGVFN